MQYACMEFKPFYKNNHNAEAHRIQELEEARGGLLRVFEVGGQCVAVFEWGTVSLPAELQGELQALVGKDCAILKLDGKILFREAGP
ncbi:MAG: hypothetical protein STSR0001_10150 [Methanothrix sp.]